MRLSATRATSIAQAGGRRTPRPNYISILKKYGTLSHLWDFGVAQGPLNYYASYPNVFLSGELVANGGFDDLSWWAVDTAGGTQTVEAVGGKLHIVSNGTGSGVYKSILTTGKTYLISLDYTAVSGLLKIDVGVTYQLSTPGRHRVTLTAGSSNFYVWRNALAAEGYVDNVSVREVYASAAAEFIAAHPLWPLWQDTAGTVPACKINDPVGLCLDQPTGVVTLGPELVSTQSVSGAAIDGATPVQTYSVGANVVPSKTYKVSATVSNYAGAGDVGFSTGTFAASTGVTRLSGNGTMAGVIVGAGAAVGQVFTRPITNTCNFSNISVREVIGAHASQATTTKRPILSNRYNILLNTETLSTQSVTTGPVPYVLSFTGTGTVTLSGTSTVVLAGTGASNRVSVTFTPTAGSLTLTVSGAVTKAQLEVV